MEKYHRKRMAINETFELSYKHAPDNMAAIGEEYQKRELLIKKITVSKNRNIFIFSDLSLLLIEFNDTDSDVKFNSPPINSVTSNMIYDLLELLQS